ncbi:ferric-chelate reductase Frp1 [Paecilomyces lecythidis]
MGFWFRDWAQYDYIRYQLKNDPITKRGFAAWCILTFIVVSSAGPIRRLSYEVFVLQHLVTFAGFLAAVWLHVPNEVKVWVWISIGLVVLDRLIRYTLVVYTNVSLFHPSTGRLQNGFFAHQASLTPLPGNVTRVIVENPTFQWKPGQHVFLACHSIVPFQNHPFTISSLPSDRRLEFLVRAEKGGTGRLFQYASKNHSTLSDSDTAAASSTKTVFLEGPYGAMRPLRQFDSVVLMAGGMGITFIVPLLRDIVEGWKSECAMRTPTSSLRFLKAARFAATKRIRLVWVIRSRAQLSWFEPQLRSVLIDLETCKRARSDFDRTIELTVYLTCDEKLDNKPVYSKPPSYNAPIQSMPGISALGGENLEDKAVEKDGVSIQMASVSQRLSPHKNNTSCLPGDGCCCAMTVDEENNTSAPRCSCSGPAPPEKLGSSSPLSREELIAPHTITPLSGRPNPQNIIRKALEQAEGESAVVVCGPPGLADDVRRSVVYLSDERAVHKGTGAQGIYLHVEAFGW